MTGRREDLYRFRTPSLRQVADTAPYMHDGSLATLEDVVPFYYRDMPATGPEGLPLDAEPLLDHSFSEVAPIVAFLKALSAEPPAIVRPSLP